MACRSSQLRWRRFLSSAKGRTCSPRRANGAARTLLTPLLVSLRPLGHGRERVGEELPLPLHPVLGQELRRPRRRGHPPNPRHRPLRAVVEEVAALGQQGVETDAELPALPHPAERPGAPSGPAPPAASCSQPASATARRLSSATSPSRSASRCSA